MPKPSFGVEITKVTEIEMAAASRGRPTFPSAAPRQAGFVLLSLSLSGLGPVTTAYKIFYQSLPQHCLLFLPQ